MATNKPITIARRRAHRGLPVEDRLLAYRVIDNRGCWNWTGDTGSQMGYGRITIGSRTNRTNKTVQVHRLAASLWSGFDIKSKMNICHKCDNPICFNPEHLFVGTALDNNRDCWAKGRHPTWPGESNPGAKLTEEKVRSIRQMKRDTGKTDKAIGVSFGVTQTMISRILRGDGWSHVK